MSATAGIALVVILALTVGLGLLLVVLVRREGPTESGLDWESAERVARKDRTESEDRQDREW